MTDPMTSFLSFQKEFKNKEIDPQKCQLGENLYMLQDDADGAFRMTYAKITGKEVIAAVSFILVEPLNGSPCFAAGYAVDPGHRKQGIGTSLLKEAIDEITQGLAKHADGHFYIEAVVGVGNTASNKISQNVLKVPGKRIVDQVSGEDAFQYIKLIELA